MKKQKIAILGSGSGTNAENICLYFKNHASVEVVFVYTNNKKAGLVNKIKRLGVSLFSLKNKKEDFSVELSFLLSKYGVDYIVLAGFLKKIPASFLKKYNQKIVNIHPSLLPKYGGKGMYGAHIHSLVIKNGEVESGITIHFVNEEYDAGLIVFQKKCTVSKNETIESLSLKIKRLEHTHYPAVLEKIICK